MSHLQQIDSKPLSHSYHDGLLDGVERDSDNGTVTLKVRNLEYREVRITLKGTDYAVLNSWNYRLMIIMEIKVYSGQTAAGFLKSENQFSKEVLYPYTSEVDEKYKKKNKDLYEDYLDRIINGELFYVDFYGDEFTGFAVCEDIEEIILS